MIVRVVRSVAAFFVICLCLMIVPMGPAEADDLEVGPWTLAVVNIDGGGLLDQAEILNFDCMQQMRYSASDLGGVIEVATGGRCIGGPDASPGWCAIGEVGCTSAMWEFHGPNCANPLLGYPKLSPGIGPHPYDNTNHKAFTLGGAEVAVLPPLCDPTEVCLTLTGSGYSSGTVITGCGPSSLDPPALPEPSGECEYGNVTSVLAVTTDELDESNLDGVHGGTWDYNAQGQWNEPMRYRFGLVEAEGIAGSEWVTYTVREGPSGPSSFHVDPRPDTRFAQINPPATDLLSPHLGVSDYQSGSSSYFGAKANWSGAMTGGSYPNLGAEPATATARLVGVGVIHKSVWTQWSNGNPWTTPSNVPDGTSVGGGFYGRNEPDRCAFYFGEKFYNLADTDVDEPEGTVIIGDEEPPDEPPPPLPEPEPDPDDDPGWWSLIVYWLKRIWGAIMGLDFGIPDFNIDFPDFGSILADAFVPDPDSWGFDSLAETFSERPPGSVIVDVTDTVGTVFAGAGGGGCGTLGTYSGVPMDCSTVVNSPSMVTFRTGVAILLWASTAFGVFRILHKAIGAGS